MVANWSDHSNVSCACALQPFLNDDKFASSKVIVVKLLPLKRYDADISSRSSLIFLRCLFYPYTERFSNDCRKTKTKAITPTNHNRSRQRDEPITIPSNHL